VAAARITCGNRLSENRALDQNVWHYALAVEAPIMRSVLKMKSAPRVIGWAMPYVVQAKSGRHGEGSFRAEKASRKDAIRVAVGLIGQGMEGVTITDEAGRVYTDTQFPDFFREGLT
jgi:hypothetical protein